jgi:hypothetical protein
MTAVAASGQPGLGQAAIRVCSAGYCVLWRVDDDGSMVGLPRLVLEPPPGYVAFVARNLEPVREEATRMVGDERVADRLYPDVLTDVAVRWGWLELRRRWLRRPDAAEGYLRRALARRWQHWQSEETWATAEPGGTVDIQVLRPDEPLPRWSRASASAAVRLAPQLAPTARPTFGPSADAAIAWWHAYETRRRRRWLVVLVAALVLVALLVRLQGHSTDTASIGLLR